jgi:hypothetical protein
LPEVERALGARFPEEAGEFEKTRAMANNALSGRFT